MAPVVGHVVAAEGQHGEGVVAQRAGLDVGRSSGDLGGHGGADEHAVGGLVLLGNQRDVGGAAATEEDGVNGDTLGGFPVGADDGALRGGDGEAAVRVSSLLAGLGGPVVAVPVDQVRRNVAVDAFPPHVAVIGQGDVREDGVGLGGLHGHGVGLVGGAGGNAEEASLGVDGAQAAILTGTHPRDVVADGLDLVAGDRGLEHGKVGLATGAREGGGDVELLAGGLAGQAQDEHVLGHPAVTLCHGRGDTQGEALLAEQGVAAVARTEGPDLVGLGEVGDVLLVVAGPGGVFLTGLEGSADRVNGGNPHATLVDEVHGSSTHAGHDAHVDNDVGGVGDLNTELGDGAAQGTHGEGHHVHGAALHGARELLTQGGLHFLGVGPVVRRAGVLFLLTADEGTGLNTRNVGRLGASQERVGALLLVELGEHAALDHLRGQAIPLLLGAVGELDGVRRGQLSNFSNPLDDIFGSVRRSGCTHVLFGHGHFAS